MMTGVVVASLAGAQMGGALALWPVRRVAAVAAPAAGALQAERINELERSAEQLGIDLAQAREERRKAVENEGAAIKARDDALIERDDLRAAKDELEVRCADLQAEGVRLRKAAVRAGIEAGAKEKS